MLDKNIHKESVTKNQKGITNVIKLRCSLIYLESNFP